MSCPCEAAEVVNDLPCGSPAILIPLANLSKRHHTGEQKWNAESEPEGDR